MPCCFQKFAKGGFARHARRYAHARKYLYGRNGFRSFYAFSASALGTGGTKILRVLRSCFSAPSTLVVAKGGVRTPKSPGYATGCHQD